MQETAIALALKRSNRGYREDILWHTCHLALEPGWLNHITLLCTAVSCGTPEGVCLPCCTTCTRDRLSG